MVRFHARAYVAFQLWTYNKLGMAGKVVEEDQTPT